MIPVQFQVFEALQQRHVLQVDLVLFNQVQVYILVSVLLGVGEVVEVLALKQLKGLIMAEHKVR